MMFYVHHVSQDGNTIYAIGFKFILQGVRLISIDAHLRDTVSLSPYLFLIKTLKKTSRIREANSWETHTPSNPLTKTKS